MTGTRSEPITLLLLVADTGGGHRSAAAAVQQALDQAYPGRFACVICDPLLGPAAPLRLRWLIGLYGPAIRLTPWLWGMLWRSCNAPGRLDLARRTLLRPAYRSVRSVVEASQPAVIAVFHPFTAMPAVAARQRSAPGAPVVTIVTDLVTAHLSWRDAGADQIVVPSAPLRHRCQLDGIPASRCAEIGLPVGAEFRAPAASAAQRRALRVRLGLHPDRFLVLVTGGAEGSGGLYRRTAALVRDGGDTDVAVICGRNRLLQRRLQPARPPGRPAAHSLRLHQQHGRLAAVRGRGGRQGRSGNYRRGRLLRGSAHPHLQPAGPGRGQRRLRRAGGGRAARAARPRARGAGT